jgi:hypothetical protein
MHAYLVCWRCHSGLSPECGQFTAKHGQDDAWLGISGQSIALDYCDLFKMIREDTSSQQSAHTSADYDGVVPVECALRRLLATQDFPSIVLLSGSITCLA